MYESFMLAQLLGLFFTVLGIGFIFNRDHIRKVMISIAENHAIQLVAAIVPLLFGGYIVIVHNDWVSNWTLIVTIVGWLIFLAGVFRAVFPSFWVARIKHINSTVPVGVVGAVMLILGLVLLYFGFHIVF